MFGLTLSEKKQCREVMVGDSSAEVLGDGRVKVERGVDGDVDLVVVHGLNTFVEEEKVFEYNMDFDSLVSMMDAFKEGEDITTKIHAYINKEPDIEFFRPSPYDDMSGKVFATIEEAILSTNTQIDAFYAPNLGTLNRYKRAGGVYMDCYFPPIDEEKDYAEILYERSLIKRASEIGMEVKISRMKLSDLPEYKYYYCGSNGEILHKLIRHGCGIEYNPIVGKSLDMGLLSVIEYADYYTVSYQKNATKKTFDYVKVPSAIRQHGHNYVLSKGYKPTIEFNLFNVVSSSFPLSNATVRPSTNNFELICPCRHISCQGVREDRTIIVNSVVVMAICEHDNAVDVISPALELSSRLVFVGLYNKERRNLKCGYNMKYRVSSSITSTYKNFNIDDKGDSMFDNYFLGFPSAWMIDAKGAYLRAYPDAVKNEYFIGWEKTIIKTQSDLGLPVYCHDGETRYSIDKEVCVRIKSMIKEGREEGDFLRDFGYNIYLNECKVLNKSHRNNNKDHCRPGDGKCYKIVAEARRYSRWHDRNQEVIPFSDLYDDDLRMRIKEDEVILSGADTCVFFPSNNGKRYVKVPPVNISRDNMFYTSPVPILEESLLSLKYVANGYAYVYSAANSSVIKTEVRRLRLRGFLGNGMKPYQYSRPSNLSYSIVESSACADFFSTCISIASFSIPILDASCRFTREVRFLEDFTDMEDNTPYASERFLDKNEEYIREVRYGNKRGKFGTHWVDGV